MENEDERQNPAGSKKGRPQQDIVFDKSESKMSYLAAVASTLISIFCMYVGRNLKQEKNQQNGDAEGQPSR